MRCKSIKYFILLGICLIPVSQTFAQRDGLSATGGSLTRNRTDPTGSSSWRSEPRTYRPVIRELGLDFPELEESYWAGHAHNKDLKFETVIKAQLAVDMTVSNPEGSELSQVIKALTQTHNNLTKALQRSLSLTEKESRELASKMNQKYDQAKRASRLSRS